MFYSTCIVLLTISFLPAIQWRVKALPQRLNTRQNVVLSNTSTCADLELYQKQQGVSGPTKDMYDMLNPQYSLTQYYLNDLDEAMNNYVPGYAAPWGVGQSMGCGIPQACYPRLNCDQLTPKDAPGAAAAYAVLLSFQNFNSYLNNLWQGLNLGNQDWQGILDKLQQSYYPPPTPDLFLREFAVGLSTIVGIIGASSAVIGPQAAAGTGSFAAVAGGIVGGVNVAAQTPEYSLQQLAELETSASAWYDLAFNQIVWANNNLTQKSMWTGSWGSATLPDVIDHGEWVDYTHHPILNTDDRKPQITIADTKAVFTKNLVAQTINYAWKEQGVYIVKYDMSEDDYNAQGNNWNPGYGDYRFRTYYGGAAFFLQRIVDRDTSKGDSPYNAYPPGWGAVAKDLASCDTACMMKSAADGFHDYGFGYNFTLSEDIYTKDQSTLLGTFQNIPRSRGFFNIPICDLTGSDRVQDISTLQGLLADQNLYVGNCDKRSIFCDCLDRTDQNGRTCEQNMPASLVDHMKTWNCIEPQPVCAAP